MADIFYEWTNFAHSFDVLFYCVLIFLFVIACYLQAFLFFLDGKCNMKSSSLNERFNIIM